MFCANVATTLDKIGIEIRSLQRTEIGEVEEAFGTQQVEQVIEKLSPLCV
jgi:adenylosuccinate lyase